MDSFFYAPPDAFISEDIIELTGQEAIHISKVLRSEVGDSITVTDGNGIEYSGNIEQLSKKTVRIKVAESTQHNAGKYEKVLALGIIRKKDRLEFAIEKAVELGITELCLFDSDHSQRNRIRTDRIQTQIISACKQSLRFYFPRLMVCENIEQVIEHYPDYHLIMAHEEVSTRKRPKALNNYRNIFFVGPEGGFSNREVNLIRDNKGELISLGRQRLRAETAVTAILSQYLFQY